MGTFKLDETLNQIFRVHKYYNDYKEFFLLTNNVKPLFLTFAIQIDCVFNVLGTSLKKKIKFCPPMIFDQIKTV